MLWWEHENGETRVALYQGHVLEVLRQLPSESVHCVVTSPPYWGLRDYGLPPVVWGGDPECPHEWRNIGVVRKGNTNGRADLGSTLASAGSPKTVGPGQTNNVGQTRQHRVDLSGFCRRCGAWRGQLGLEPSVDLYVEHMVEIFREVRRVLRSDGTLWLNLGDTYMAQQGVGFNGQRRMDEANRNIRLPRQDGIKRKDLVGLPWMVAFALRADGWYLRSDIVWAKSNPLPESVTDRPTRAHEFIFLLSKRPRYFYDADAIREPHTKQGTPGHLRSGAGNRHPNHQGLAGRLSGPPSSRVKTAETPHLGGRQLLPEPGEDGAFHPLGRNRRSVWWIATQQYPESHFATFPEALPELCILAGSSPRACPKCGAPWKRKVEVRGGTIGHSWHDHDNDLQDGKSRIKYGSLASAGNEPYQRIDHGFEPGCTCPGNDGSGRCVVLDPFVGSGTTLLVAQRLGRSAIGIDLNPDYLAMARRRIEAEHAQRRLPVGF